MTHLTQPPMPLAELNFGTLRHDWDDPRVAPFVEAIDKVNAIARRSPGFIWMLGDEEMDAAQKDPDGPFGDNKRVASTLSVWEDGASLMAFVHKTLHQRFMVRAADWFEPLDRSHLVMWPVAIGHRPTLAEGLERFRQWQAEGDTPMAFGAKGGALFGQSGRASL